MSVELLIPETDEFADLTFDGGDFSLRELPLGQPRLAILGTRGVPARHGGFETFAERLACYLVDRGWEITVYCQAEGRGPLQEDWWRGVRRITIPVKRTCALGTVMFDFKSTLDALRRETLLLTLGYNTALFCGAYRLAGKTNLINMDGLEWQRAKWSRAEKWWLYLNERCGCLFGNQLIADHPEIASHLSTRVSTDKIAMIPYGADEVTQADESVLSALGLQPNGFALVVARPEPENSVMEIVSAFSAQRRSCQLVVLGKYQPETNRYHAQVLAAASDQVVFPGAIYEQEMVNALRLNSRLYVHGHTVGGTNPALVEALGAGCPVLAHDNRFNRWVAGRSGAYFQNREECEQQLSLLLDDMPLLEGMSLGSRGRHQEAFTWDKILAEYERLLGQYVTPAVTTPAFYDGRRIPQLAKG